MAKDNHVLTLAVNHTLHATHVDHQPVTGAKAKHTVPAGKSVVIWTDLETGMEYDPQLCRANYYYPNGIRVQPGGTVSLRQELLCKLSLVSSTGDPQPPLVTDHGLLTCVPDASVMELRQTNSLVPYERWWVVKFLKVGKATVRAEMQYNDRPGQSTDYDVFMVVG